MAQLVSTCQAGGCLEITVYVTARFRLRVKSMVCVILLPPGSSLMPPQSLPVIMRYQMHHCSDGDIVDLLSAQLCSVFSKSQSKVKISTDLKIRTLTCTVKDSNLLPFILVGINPLKFELTGISLPPYMNVKKHTWACRIWKYLT